MRERRGRTCGSAAGGFGSGGGGSLNNGTNQVNRTRMGVYNGWVSIRYAPTP